MSRLRAKCNNLGAGNAPGAGISSDLMNQMFCTSLQAAVSGDDGFDEGRARLTPTRKILIVGAIS